jgi:hypothetical protein
MRTNRQRSSLRSFIVCALVLVSLVPSHVDRTPRVQAETRTVLFEFSDVVYPGGDSRALAVAFHAMTFLDAEAYPVARNGPVGLLAEPRYSSRFPAA